MGRQIIITIIVILSMSLNVMAGSGELVQAQQAIDQEKTTATINKISSVNESKVKLVVDGKEIILEDKILIVQGRTFLPARKILEILGAEVSYIDAPTSGTKYGVAIAKLQDTTLRIPIYYSDDIVVNDKNSNASSTEEVSTEEVSTEEVSTEEVSTEEVSTEEVSTEEVSTEEVSTEEVSTEEVSTEEASTEETNTEAVSIEDQAFIYNSRTYIPIRFITENLGFVVKWDGIQYKVIIKTSLVASKETEESILQEQAIVADVSLNYYVYSNEKYIYSSNNYIETLKFAINYKDSYIYNRFKDSIDWKNVGLVKESVLLNVPFISQFPELIRGCEVTSMTMMLNYLGVNVNKMDVAYNIDKDNTPYRVRNGQIYYGDPSVGFIGSMTDSRKSGYGSNYAPTYRLFKSYLGEDKVLNLTGLDFEVLYYFLSEGAPIWVLTNTDLKGLPPSQFYTWKTPTGKIITATNKEHAVVITGYDKDYIYINDPMYTKTNRKVNKQHFIEAWKQMGKEAVVCLP